jgi:hypothetical protein
MARTSKDERLRLIKLGPVPKGVDMEEIEGEEDKVEDGVFIKHYSKIKPDKAQWSIVMDKEVSLRDCIGQRDWKKGDHHGEAQHT